MSADRAGLIREDFGSIPYWNSRFEKQLIRDRKAVLESYMSGKAAVSALLPFLIETPSSAPILEIGCGLSLLGKELTSAGFSDVTAVDHSTVAIDAQRERHGRVIGVRYLVADARELSLFAPSSLAVVVDKGCLDTVYSGAGSSRHVASVIQEVDRVLCVGGLFLCISSGPVEPRRQDLNINQSHSWSVEPIALAPVDVLAGGDGPLLPLHLFVCKKKAEAAQ